MRRTLHRKDQEKKDGSPSVFVGLSGGVDSSVSAALLCDRGYDVTGVFIRVWSPPWMVCTQKEDEKSAREVAEYLGIPFRVLDLSDTYKREIVDNMIAAYASGRTPNPDVLCNRHIKFGGFLSWAIAEGADVVATGHYARVAPIKRGWVARMLRPQGATSVPFALLRGVDKNKDQSYFLWTLGQHELKHALFPVGGYTKPEVRAIATTYGLPTATRKDSQGLCFVGHVDMKEFLGHYIEQKTGDVLDRDGRIIGYHDGAHLLTIGQRHGFIITEKTPDDTPYYVVSKDVAKNTITVAHEGEKALWEMRDVDVENISWTGNAPVIDRRYTAQIRYRQNPMPCVVKNIDFTKKTASIYFNEALIFAPGQSLVFYDTDICMGGGIIMEYNESRER